MSVDAKVMNLAVRYWYARDTLTPEQAKFCEELLSQPPSDPPPSFQRFVKKHKDKP